MALRNYLYAKHLDPLQSTLINRDPKLSMNTRFVDRKQHIDLDHDQSTLCPPERQLELADGTKVCANCADCPKKTAPDDGAPKIRVQLDELSSHVYDLTMSENEAKR